MYNTKLINRDIHTIDNKGLVSVTTTNIEIGYALNSTHYTPHTTHHTTYDPTVKPPSKEVTTEDIREYNSRFTPTIAISNGADSHVGFIMSFDDMLIDTYTRTSEKQDTRNTLGEHITTMNTPKTRLHNDGSIGEIYYSSSWASAIQLKGRINLKDMIPTVKNTRWFRLQLLLQRNHIKATKRQIRRDIAKQKNSITKTDKVIQLSRQKRVKVILPSQR